MQLFHHILFSRTLGVVAFCLFLVLTPRAWIEPERRGVTEEVPVDVLETPSDCLWCDPAPTTECDDDSIQAPPSTPHWLNPDQSARPLEAPCRTPDSPHA